MSDGLLSREAEPETQDLHARVFPFVAIPIGLGAAAAAGGGIYGGVELFKKVAGKSKRENSDDLLSREAEPETQELHARVLPLLIGASALGLAGTSGALVGSLVKEYKDDKKKEKQQGKRGISDDLLSREAQDWAKWAESVRNQASKREPSHI